jgi:hypothetical protein
MPRYDIRRQITEADTAIGGVTVTSTAIETRYIDLQHLNLQNYKGEQTLNLGGLQIEANYIGFCHKDTDIQEQDYLTDDSGTTNYQVVFVQDLWPEHIEFFAKKVLTR